jgi:demethylmenaquinone methyltransferase/2-methoxy-6-polyprenyl-1,4-benzoquinol methylase
VALLEASAPDLAILRAGHGLYFRRVVPAIGGMLSDRAAYAYLPRSMSYLPSGEEMTEMLREAGFPDAARSTLSGGITQLLTGTRG